MTVIIMIINKILLSNTQKRTQKPLAVKEIKEKWEGDGGGGRKRRRRRKRLRKERVKNVKLKKKK